MTVTDGSIRAIPTRYRGYNFRSRLEARWAVCFDTLGMRWEYEPQGFELHWRLRLDDRDDGAILWLPDFYLPDSDTYVEVKGRWTPTECDRFLNAAASLSDSCSGPNVAILSALPQPGAHSGPATLHMHKGDLMAGPWNPRRWECGGYGNPDFDTIAVDVGGDDVYRESRHADGWGQPIEVLAAVLLTYEYVPNYHLVDEQSVRALDAARSARFEHGESGAT